MLYKQFDKEAKLISVLFIRAEVYDEQDRDSEREREWVKNERMRERVGMNEGEVAK